MMGSNVERELWSVKEVATVLGICTRGVWRLVARGELSRPLRVGRSARWRMVHVRAFIDQREREAVG